MNTEPRITITLDVTPAQLAAVAGIMYSPQVAPVQATPADELGTNGVEIPPEPVAEVPQTPEPVAEVPPAPTPVEVPAAPAPAETPEAVAEWPKDNGHGVMVDARGYPWDSRIHGAAKNLNKDNTWRYRQGIDRKTLVPQVEAELLQTLSANALAGAGQSVPAPTTEVQQEQPAVNPFAAPEVGNEQSGATAVAGTSVTETVPTPPQNAVAPAPVQDTAQAVVPPAEPVNDFGTLLTRVTAAKAAGTLDDTKIAQVCAELGLPAFANLATAPKLISQAAEKLGV